MSENRSEKIGKKQNGTEKPNFIPWDPGIEDVSGRMLKELGNGVATFKEFDTLFPSMYRWVVPIAKLDGKLLNPDTAGIYLRAEPDLQALAEKTYQSMIREMINMANELLKELDPKEDSEEYGKWEGFISSQSRKLLHDGITSHEINEVLANLRRKTYVDRQSINPRDFIPTRSGLLSTRSWKVKEFLPRYFYTWKINGDYDPSVKSLKYDTPMFYEFLMDSYQATSIPRILDYLAYGMYPDNPQQKVLGIFGPEGTGKGVLLRLYKKIIGKAFGTFSMASLLDHDSRFPYQNIEGKGVLTDPEMPRVFNKKVDFSKFNLLFGGDTIPVEEKFKGVVDMDHNPYAAIILGNLPLFKRDGMSAFHRRWIIALTHTRRQIDRERIPNLEEKIWEAEGDKIISLLLNRLKSLQSRGWKFCNAQSDDEIANLWESLANSPFVFIHEMVVDATGGELDQNVMYNSYTTWCEAKGIPAEALHQFTRAMNAMKYGLKRKRNGFDRFKKPQFINRFHGCALYEYVTFEEYENQKKTESEELGKEEERKATTAKYVQDMMKDS